MSISFFLFNSNKTFKHLRKKNTVHGVAILIINKVSVLLYDELNTNCWLDCKVLSDTF